MKIFAVQYTIDGVKGYDPKSFLSAVKSVVVNFFKEHRNIKFKLILKCNMAKTDIATGEVIRSIAAFQSLIEIILKKTTTLLNLQNMFRQKLLSSSVDRFTKR